MKIFALEGDALQRSLVDHVRADSSSGMSGSSGLMLSEDFMQMKN